MSSKEKKTEHKRIGWLPEDDWLPLDMQGHPNRSYLGHTSDIIPTPWPYEGQPLPYNMPNQRRRMPQRKSFTKGKRAEFFAFDKERQRLAEIENPGRCQSRKRQYDAWCRAMPVPGTRLCRRHTPTWDGRQAAVRARKEELLMRKIARILKNPQFK